MKGIPNEIVQLSEFMHKKNQDYSLTTIEHPAGITVNVPSGFKADHKGLYVMVNRSTNENEDIHAVHTCRNFPIITKALDNVEKSELYYEVCWTNKGKIHREVVPALTISTQNEIRKLANKSLAVNDRNSKNLITYFDKYLSVNDIEHITIVDRLGHVNESIIHPLQTEGLEILPNDIGEKQILEAFQSSGSSKEWIESVLKLVEPHPKALLMIVSSFTSVLLEDLKLGPFIIDLSGPTSKGKTSVLKAAASVWGTEHLVSEWNGTAVSFERKAAFLNSFPLCLDDSMKADERQLQRFVYNFSGGRSKGRGSVEGSQKEYTWNNLMLSTGETSLVDYAERAGGASARVLPIKGLPFNNVDHHFFSELYGSIEKNHGTIGLEFISKWNERKKELLPLYFEYNEKFQQKAQGNEVVSRIARHYSAIYFTAALIIDFFDAPLDIGWLEVLFDEIMDGNEAIDKPMQLLESILSDLDASRECVSGKYAKRHDIKAIYQGGQLFLLPKYLKEFLGAEQTSIRGEWLRRGISMATNRNGKDTDTRQIKHDGKNYRPVPIDPAIIEKLGYDFDEYER